MKVNNLIIPLILFAIIIGVFIFLVTTSYYPVGDDPGLHTSILRYSIDNESMDFISPFFPQLEQSISGGRFITNIFLTIISKVTGVDNVFTLTVYFAAFCLSFSLLFVYLIIKYWLNSRIVALLVVPILGFSKWYQGNFWEGSYDQCTGLLLLSALILLLFKFHKEKKFSFIIIPLFLLASLYKTHELGFLIGFALISVVMFLYLKEKAKPMFFYIIAASYIILLGAIYIVTKPGYFAANATGYPIPILLGVSEGTPILLYALMLIGVALLLFKNKNLFIFSWLAITFIFSQSFIFDLPFYPYRFNLYFIQALAVVASLPILLILKCLPYLPYRRIGYAIVLIVIIVGILLPQFSYIHGLSNWITNQNSNPASIILEDDLNAYIWLGENTDSEAVILAPLKWGYYIPAIARRSVVLDNAIGGDERDSRSQIAGKASSIYTTVAASDAHALAQDIEVDYIIWDLSISRFPKNFPDYNKKKFIDSDKFEKVYEQNQVTIYQVQ